MVAGLHMGERLTWWSIVLPAVTPVGDQGHVVGGGDLGVWLDAEVGGRPV